MNPTEAAIELNVSRTFGGDASSPHPNPPPQGGREAEKAAPSGPLPPCGGGLGWGEVTGHREPPAHPISPPRWACPSCRAALHEGRCGGCGRDFPSIEGLPDLRLTSDRFLDLANERAKAARLARLAPGLDLKGLAEAYYAMTPDVDPRRRRFYLDHILGAIARGEVLAALLPRKGKTLEVGCGTGGLLAAATARGLDIEGTDIALRWLVVARRRLDDLGRSCRLVAASADRLPYPDASFDALVADSVLEHTDDPGAAVAEWARVLKPGGTLLTWSPNRFTLAVDPHVRLWGLGYLPRHWMPAYVRWRRGGAWPPRCLSAGEARRMARSARFEDIQVEPPAIPDSWAEGRSKWERALIRGYSLARRVGPSRSVLRGFGPLWQLRATRGGAA